MGWDGIICDGYFQLGVFPCLKGSFPANSSRWDVFTTDFTCSVRKASSQVHFVFECIFYLCGAHILICVGGIYCSVRQASSQVHFVFVRGSFFISMGVFYCIAGRTSCEGISALFESSFWLETLMQKGRNNRQKMPRLEK